MTLTPILTVSLVLLGCILVTVPIMMYNRLVRLKNRIEKAWANIDVLLKQRHDELPNIIAVVKGYAAYERKLQTAIAHARTAYAGAASMSSKAAASSEVSAVFTTFLGIAENYPKLAANEHYLALQKRISELENNIAERRTFYNESVTVYNTRIEEVPYNIFAKLFGYTRKDLFSFQE